MAEKNSLIEVNNFDLPDEGGITGWLKEREENGTQFIKKLAGIIEAHYDKQKEK